MPHTSTELSTWGLQQQAPLKEDQEIEVYESAKEREREGRGEREREREGRGERERERGRERQREREKSPTLINVTLQREIHAKF